MPDFYAMYTGDIIAWLQTNPAATLEGAALDELFQRCGAAVLTDLEKIGYTMATPSVEAALARQRAYFAALRVPEPKTGVPDIFFRAKLFSLPNIDY